MNPDLVIGIVAVLLAVIGSALSLFVIPNARHLGSVDYSQSSESLDWRLCLTDPSESYWW